MKYFSKEMTLEEVKAAYKVAAMRLHPDRGGSTEAMQELNNAFEIAFAMAQKFSKANTTDTKQQPKTAESASSYRRQFYTVNGWQGERYDRNLTTKDIAQLIREYVKTAYPTYRFSITSDVNSITIALTEYPVELTNKTLIASYFLMMEDDFMFCDVRRGTFRYKRDITPTETERLIDDLYKYAGLYVRITKYDTWLNPEILDVLMSIQKQLDAYNRKGEVYRDVLFHDCINIGKINPRRRDQYAQIVPRSPTGRRLPLFKRTAPLTIGE